MSKIAHASEELVTAKATFVSAKGHISDSRCSVTVELRGIYVIERTTFPTIFNLAFRSLYEEHEGYGIMVDGELQGTYVEVKYYLESGVLAHPSYKLIIWVNTLEDVKIWDDFFKDLLARAEECKLQKKETVPRRVIPQVE